MASLRIELLTDLLGIEESAWDRAVAMSPTRSIFQTLAWQRSWWKAFGRGHLLLMAVYESDQLIGIAPLFADQGMVYFVGSGGSDYLDFIGMFSNPQLLLSVLKLAREQAPDFVGFHFYHIPEGSPTIRNLVAIAPELGLNCFDEGTLDAPSLRFQDWPVAKRLPSQKKSLVRHEHALRKLGNLVVDHFSEGSQIEPLLSAFFDQHIGRWAATPFPSLFLDQKQCEFYQILTQTVSSRGWLRFTRVSIDNQPIAFHFGFLFQDSFLWYKPSFEIRYADKSPGEVLLRSLLIQSQIEGVKLFDFGLGDEPFKERFTTEIRRVRTWSLYPIP